MLRHENHGALRVNVGGMDPEVRCTCALVVIGEMHLVHADPEDTLVVQI